MAVAVAENSTRGIGCLTVVVQNRRRRSGRSNILLRDYFFLTGGGGSASQVSQTLPEGGGKFVPRSLELEDCRSGMSASLSLWV